MGQLQSLFQDFGPAVSVTVLALIIAGVIHLLSRRSQKHMEDMVYPLLTWVVLSLALLIVIVLLPISDETQGQILSLLGIVLTAVIALSSTTFVSNAMAGIMLQLTQPFRPGDYVRVNGEFGRVTRRSLVHTQIQTEWRDIATLPNLLLVTSPITVLHRDGTIISAEVSIGYDVAYTEVQELLIIAGEEAGLSEPFVLVQELLDHAVVYRICGFLPEMKHPLSARSNLRKKVLEQLHGSQIEIVSPSFMNQRQLDPERRVLPERPVLHHGKDSGAAEPAPEEKIFDKAEEAAGQEDLRRELEETQAAIKEGRSKLKSVAAEDREAMESQLARLETKAERLGELLESASAREKT